MNGTGVQTLRLVLDDSSVSLFLLLSFSRGRRDIYGRFKVHQVIYYSFLIFITFFKRKVSGLGLVGLS